MALERERIRNALLVLALAGPYHPISLDTNTKVATADTNVNVAPKSALVNEISQSFTEAHTRRSRKRDTQVWNFELRLFFPQEVTLEAFEAVMNDDPPILARSATQRQVTLLLESVQYRHPVQQQPAGGSEAIYQIRAELSPK